MKKIFPIAIASMLLLFSCLRIAQKSNAFSIKEKPAVAFQKAKEIRAKAPLKVAEGLEVSLWASDTLAPDPVAMSIDRWGRVYLTRTNRQKNSEFDIRGHRDWMTESISLQTVEERRAFLHKTFAPERSKENEWLKDLNFDGSHDWKDLTVEKEEVWRLEDTNKDGVADISTRVLEDFNDEVSDIAAGLLVRDHDAFLTCAPDVWHLQDENKDGIWEKKTSISHGYAVHIGFGGHNLSGIVEGPDGRLYWNMGDIGANITTVDGKKIANPNSGFIARSNPDGTDFEIFATGLRNTHEFAFDEYGNLISSDNDGDHAGESERLVHVVEGADAGWRSNWQYGKYTDPKNNRYNVWMDEKLSVPHWEGQAAYIIPPIQNYHNGPTGMVYNPGTALGAEWKNKFFLVEFVGSASNSPIWAFDLKPKGASFELKSEQNVFSGVLPTGIQFGPDGALYVADWVTGWDTKDYGRVWKLDVTKDKNNLAAERAETKRLIQLDYAKQSPEKLYELLFYQDMRVRQRAQFELVNRGAKGFPLLKKAISQNQNQLARVHGIWGIGQLARKDKTFAEPLIGLLKDADQEIIAQSIKTLGDAEVKTIKDDLIKLLESANYRIKFYAAEALGQIGDKKAIQPLINMLEKNNDEDLYLRHAGVLALSRIGDVDSMTALLRNGSKALRTAAVLVLRKLKSEKIALFLNDQDEYIVTEAARAINDDLSIPAALPALAAVLNEKKFTSEALLRRGINAALRVGGEKELNILIDFVTRSDISTILKAEALSALGTWAMPSVLDRVDGRFRGKVERDLSLVQSKIKPLIKTFLQEKNTEVLIASTGMLANLQISDANEQLAKIYNETQENKVKIAILSAFNQVKYEKMEEWIKIGMNDKEASVRTAALGLLSNANVSKENLPVIVDAIFSNGTIKEQQQLLTVMCKFDAEKTIPILSNFVRLMQDKKLSPDLSLELKEAVDASNSADLKAKLAALTSKNSLMDDYMEALYGGDKNNGFVLFTYNSTAQCVRCHTVNNRGSNVGPNLTTIGDELSREQLLQAMIEPSVRLAPGYGNVVVNLKGGQEASGILMKETADALTLKTSDAEPLIIPISRIEKRKNLPSSMPVFHETLSKREIRDIVAYLTSLKK